MDPNLLTGFGLDLGNLPPGVDASVLIQQLAQFGFGKPVKDGGGLTALVLAAREDCLDQLHRDAPRTRAREAAR